jgi:hypothetical protein
MVMMVLLNDFSVLGKTEVLNIGKKACRQLNQLWEFSYGIRTLPSLDSGRAT